MRPYTRPLHYYDETVYSNEKENIFYTTWQFACFKSQVKHHNDFVAFKLCDKDIVVQNFQGELRAFANVCTHRYSIIQKEQSGNRHLRCCYHGWTFNKDGIPIGVPNKEDFENFDPKDFALARYDLDLCNELVFIKIRKSEQTLKDYLGLMYDRISLLSKNIDVVFDMQVYEANTNWKSMVEISLEGYHVNVVHPNSISTYFEVKSNQKTTPIEIFNFFAPHSYLSASVSEEELCSWKKIKNQIGVLDFLEDLYSQHNVFPNFNLATFYGSAYFSQVFRPISADKCLIYHFSLSAKQSNQTKKSQFVYNEIMQKMTKNGHTILSEDIGACENVQKVVRNAKTSGISCKAEARVELFQKAYMQYLDLK